MRIAYIGPYQGRDLVKSRPSILNFTLGGKMKIELIAELLNNRSHEVEILSQGDVDRFEFRFYSALQETDSFAPGIPVLYASALPIKYVNGFWSSYSMLRLFKARHRAAPFDLIIIYNLKRGHMACARYARRALNLPVILEYEDDAFLDGGVKANRFLMAYHHKAYSRMLKGVSGCMAGSPQLLSQVPGDVPKLLLCGVVGEAIINTNNHTNDSRKNWVVFSGTHSKPQGLEQLVKAWQMVQLPDWQLHIAGHGEVTATLHKMSEKTPSIVFHGLLSREDNARLLGSGKIGIVPYDVSQTSGFSFKTIEFLAARLHVITTPLAALNALDPELKNGITYIDDNRPETIAASLKAVILQRRYEQTVAQETIARYGPAAVSQLLAAFIEDVTSRTAKENGHAKARRNAISSL